MFVPRHPWNAGERFVRSRNANVAAEGLIFLFSTASCYFVVLLFCACTDPLFSSVF